MSTRFRLADDCLIAVKDDGETEIVATLDPSPVIAKMLQTGIPVTRENYIRMNYWEDKELSPEEEAELPRMFRDQDQDNTDTTGEEL